jgi:hypothetical protein
MPQVAEEISVSDSGYTFPVEDILTGRGAIFGKSGSGKSNTATVVVEELLAEGLPLLIVDQDGEYYGLREEFELLHVGADSNCDRIIGVDDAASVADIALEDNTPVILDVSGYMEEDTAQEIVQKVLQRLFRRENDLKKPFLVLVEEIHEYVPEQGAHGELGEMLIRVAKRGRKRGLGICGISQRPASVSKNFITQCDWIVWHRLTWDNDTKVVGRILGSDYEDRVTDLSNGEAYVMTDWAEDLRRIKFRLKHTHGGGGTPGLENLGDAADRPSGQRSSETSTDEDTTGETEDGAGESDGAVEAATEDDRMPGRAADPEPAGGAEESGTSHGPQPPQRVESNEGNAVWEFAQMTHYLLALMVYKTRTGTRALMGALTPDRSTAANEPEQDSSEEAGDSTTADGGETANTPTESAPPPAWQRDPRDPPSDADETDPRMVATGPTEPDGADDESPAEEASDQDTEAGEDDEGVDQEFVERVLAKHDLGTDPDAEDETEET